MAVMLLRDASVGYRGVAGVFGLLLVAGVLAGVVGCATTKSFGGPGHDGERLLLLLPEKGTWQEAGRAVADGFEAAKKADAAKEARLPKVVQRDSGTPAAAEKAVKSWAKAAAVPSGAKHPVRAVVVGPLQRGSVQRIARSTTFPVLALNTFRGQPPANLYQLTLEPRDDVRDISDKLAAAKKRTVLILRPAGEWGQVMASALVDRDIGNGIDWSTVTYPVSANPARRVRQEDLAGKDAIVLLATRDLAVHLYPVLKDAVSGVPFIATSHVNNGKPETRLDGLFFVDIPGLIPGGGRTEQRKYPEAYSSGFMGRLYALGQDAYSLAPVIASGEPRKKGEVYFGQTGELRISGQNKVERTLALGRFGSNGRVTAATLGDLEQPGTASQVDDASRQQEESSSAPAPILSL